MALLDLVLSHSKIESETEFYDLTFKITEKKPTTVCIRFL